MKILLSFLFCVFLFSFCFAQTSVQGKVTVEDTAEDLIGANISFKKNGDFITGVATDFDGNYKINIDPGTYDIVASYIGLSDMQINGIIVKNQQTTFLNITFINKKTSIEDLRCGVFDLRIPLIDKDNTTSGEWIIDENIQRAPFRNLKKLAAGTAGVTSY